MIENIIEHDQQQRRLALQPDRSFIVQAPAGSGKTELLIQRMLVLLATANKPEEILAITFTKKAANEMRERVIRALKEAAGDAPTQPHKLFTWHLAQQVLKRDQQCDWQLVHNPNQLRIQTIDALCAYLTRQLPLLSTFGAQPDIADHAQSIYETAVREVLTHLEDNVAWSEAIGRLLLHLDNDMNKTESLLVHLLQKRDQWLPHIHLEESDLSIKTQLENNLACIIEERLEKLCHEMSFALSDELLAMAQFAANNLALSGQPSTLLTALPGHQVTDMHAWIIIASLLLTNDGDWRKQVTVKNGFPPDTKSKNPIEKALFKEYKQRMLALLTALSANEPLRQALHQTRLLPDSVIDDAQWEILIDLIHVLKIVTAQLRLTFQQYGQIDYVENALASLTALGNHEHPTDLALALDYQIRHILIDEFQDTSSTQYKLLEKLTLGWTTQDGRTLFVVGDPMQSIYRFREAEVGLFLRMWHQGIGDIRLQPITLSLNFRSTAEIVHWNNTHFSAIFPKQTDISAGAVAYSRSATPQTDSPVPDSHINIRGFTETTSDAQAQHIVDIINTAKKHDHSIAILVRSRTHLTGIMPALRQAGIAYHAVDIDPLASRQAIQDLFALTRALLHLDDRIAWLAVLRAPWCGLSLADIHQLAGNPAPQNIFLALQKHTGLSADGQERLKRLLPILEKQLANRNRGSLRHWIESTWLLIGGPASLQQAEDIQDTAIYFRLLDKLAQGQQTVVLENLQEHLNRLFAAANYTDGTVQIMTMHSAKGLEFDTVILPHLERKMPHDDKALLQWMEQPLTSSGENALLLATLSAAGENDNSLYKYISAMKKQKMEHEANRLFYVAATRAKKQLHLLFNTRIDNETAAHGSFLQALMPHINRETALSASTPIEEVLPSCTVRPLRRLALEWQSPLQENKQKSAGVHQTHPGFQLSNPIAKQIGTVTHAILQQLAAQGIQWWQTKSAEEQRRHISQHLRLLGAPAHQLSTAVTRVINMIQPMLADQQGCWILQPHQSARSELSITTLHEGKPVTHIIDRTFIDEQGTRWVIDYKTSTLTQGELADFLAAEQDKYLQKMQAYAQAMNALEGNRPIMLGLYFPALAAWKTWAFKETNQDKVAHQG